MRIAKVALAFFSIGFLAGSFERAAGLGHSELTRAAEERRVGAAIVFSAAHAFSDFGPRGPLPRELAPAAPSFATDLPEAVIAGLSSAQALEPTQTAVAVRNELHGLDPNAFPAFVPMVSPVRRPSFGIKRMSQLDLRPRSKMPEPLPMSLRSWEAWGSAPWSDDGKRDDVSGPEFIMPFERGRVTSLFNQGRYHPAIDLAGSLGSRVHSTTRRQRVTFTGWRNGYGNTVMTRDDSGRTHLYGHLQRIFTKMGTILDQGQLLGALGSTGHSTGPHVHYEVKTRNGAHVDPVTLLFGRRVGRGYAWNGSRSVTRVAARTDRQPRPR